MADISAYDNMADLSRYDHMDDFSHYDNMEDLSDHDDMADLSEYDNPWWSRLDEMSNYQVTPEHFDEPSDENAVPGTRRRNRERRSEPVMARQTEGVFTTPAYLGGREVLYQGQNGAVGRIQHAPVGLEGSIWATRSEPANQSPEPERKREPEPIPEPGPAYVPWPTRDPAREPRFPHWILKTLPPSSAPFRHFRQYKAPSPELPKTDAPPFSLDLTVDDVLYAMQWTTPPFSCKA